MTIIVANGLRGTVYGCSDENSLHLNNFSIFLKQLLNGLIPRNIAINLSEELDAQWRRTNWTIIDNPVFGRNGKTLITLLVAFHGWNFVPYLQGLSSLSITWTPGRNEEYLQKKELFIVH
jgi:hypothetical protein